MRQDQRGCGRLFVDSVVVVLVLLLSIFVLVVLGLRGSARQGAPDGGSVVSSEGRGPAPAADEVPLRERIEEALERAR